MTVYNNNMVLLKVLCALFLQALTVNSKIIPCAFSLDCDDNPDAYLNTVSTSPFCAITFC